MGVELMVSVWPTVNPKRRHLHADAQRRLAWSSPRAACRCSSPSSTPTPVRIYKVPVTYYDPTHPQAREFVLR